MNETTTREDPELVARLRALGDPDAGSDALERTALAVGREAEVAYTTIDTPLGEAMIAGTELGLLALNLPGLDADEELEVIAERISPRIAESAGRLDEARRELDEYFAGTRREFDLSLDRRLMRRGFTTDVLRVTAAIPYGVTSSYGEVASRAGRPRAYRAAGTALGSNPLAIVVPCHRVLRAGGDVGHYGGGPEMKRWLLEHEGAIGQIAAPGQIGG